jgi:Tfp pilus assembly protein PilW
MRRVRRHLRRVDDERGFMLVELMAASMMGVVVVGTAVALFTSGVRSQNGIAAHASGIQQSRAMVERMVREVRQGWSVSTATPSQLTMLTYVPSATCGGAHATTAIACRVTYSCSGSVCMRTEANADGSGAGPAIRVASGLSSSSVFTYAPSASAPTYVGISLTLIPQYGHSAMQLDDGAALGRIGS